MSEPKCQRLFTPGPINTSAAVHRAMQRDVGSREDSFIQVVRHVRTELSRIAGGGPEFTAVPMQGSGTFAVEAAVGSLVPADGKLLVLVNGAYGRRIVAIAERLGIAVGCIESPETERNDPAFVKAHLAAHPEITHVAAVHCETTTGMLNPIAEIGKVVAASGRRFMVDAMSSFGGLPLDVAAGKIDCLISSPNKCLESVPGIGFAIVRAALLEESRGRARSLSLDLSAQWDELERSGEFRFTPPTQVILALAAALEQLAREGGMAAREKRYRENHRALMSGMTAMGFQPVLRDELQSPIITAFHFPADPRFDFDDFYRGLVARGLVIYPGKLSLIKSFRIGTIGQLTLQDFAELLEGIRSSLDAMGLQAPPGDATP
ncbi:MAG TPA: 2-aminoethylphosphonate--pyruvate transaminase [Verrucomicrobiaceae bacterium]